MTVTLFNSVVFLVAGLGIYVPGEDTTVFVVLGFVQTGLAGLVFVFGLVVMAVEAKNAREAKKEQEGDDHDEKLHEKEGRVFNVPPLDIDWSESHWWQVFRQTIVDETDDDFVKIRIVHIMAIVGGLGMIVIIPLALIELYVDCDGTAGKCINKLYTPMLILSFVLTLFLASEILLQWGYKKAKQIIRNKHAREIDEHDDILMRDFEDGVMEGLILAKKLLGTALLFITIPLVIWENSTNAWWVIFSLRTTLMLSLIGVEMEGLSRISVILHEMTGMNAIEMTVLPMKE
eukprot:TRINITY_DN3441_c0_g3_i4.p1 TRINITY_DN3441_c0_g3~~TRINITY_DN3441_c0_g3_i4.p1  ORF type:complete len:289 (-),score=103.86 TRINITY_DN3441_c0_g3_i4:1601-2467(-)